MIEQAKPKLMPSYDIEFIPAVLYNKAYQQLAAKSGKSQPISIALQRPDGTVSRFDTFIAEDSSIEWSHTLLYVERLIKFLLWQKGGQKLYVGGSQTIAEHLQKVYSPAGERHFDCDIVKKLYDKPLEVLSVKLDDVPTSNESSKSIGRHLEGCRIGFDAGASDRKVSAVIDGKPIYSEEIIWNPRFQMNPDYFYDEINKSFKAAAGKLPRVDAIGVSSAGIYINNETRIASLFRSVPKEQFDSKIRDIFIRLGEEWGVPIEVANDGDVTALAGSMSLGVNGILGVALGSSEAAGYVNRDGNITGWLNELAFTPIDYSPIAPLDEWSGDRGVGAQYLSQQAIFRLAQKADIHIDPKLGLAEKLKVFQDLHKTGDYRTKKIYETIGIYLGYALAHYATFYDMGYALILGRVTSGSGGQIIIDKANEVLNTEFPEIADKLEIHLPDEKSRRVGQSVAAASLPEIRK